MAADIPENYEAHRDTFRLIEDVVDRTTALQLKMTNGSTVVSIIPATADELKQVKAYR